MAVNDVTGTWKQPAGTGGLYVVRSEQEAHRNLVRIGAGGNKRGKAGLRGRLMLHQGRPPRKPANPTLRFRRWEVLNA